MDANVKKYLFDPYMDMNMWMLENPDQFIAGGGTLAALGLDTAFGNKPSKWAARALFSPNHYFSGKELPDYKIPAPDPINKVGAYLKALGKISGPISLMMPSELASGEMTDEWRNYANELGNTIYTTNEDIPKTKTIEGQPHELAYITPEEAELLKSQGGAGIDSDNDGIKEYFFSFDDISSGFQDTFDAGVNTIKDIFRNPQTVANERGKAEDDANVPEEDQRFELKSDSDWFIGQDYDEGDYYTKIWDQPEKVRADGTVKDDDPVYNTGTGTGAGTTTTTEPVVNNYDLSGLQGTYGQASSVLGGADIYSFLNGLGSTGSNISSSIGTLSGLSGYDNQADIDALLGQFQGLDSQYGALKGQYDTAVSKTNQAIDEYEKSLAKSALGISDLGIQDVDDVKALKKQLNLADIDYDYDTGIDRKLLEGLNLGQDYQADYTTAINDLDAILGNYDKALTKLGTDLGGIGFDNLLTTAEGLGLKSDMAATQDLLDQYQDKATDFGKASGLSSDQVQDYFKSSGYVDTAQDIQDAITKAVDARTAEETRISDAEKDALSLANTVLGNVGASGIYSKAILDQLQKAITEGKGKYSDFKSELGFDFSPSTNIFTTAQSSLDDLIADRKKEVDKIEDAITQAYSPFSGLELQEESEFNKIKQALNDADYDLGYFSGGRVGDLYNTLDSYRDNVTAKLGELATKREGIEGQAQDVMAQLMDDITTRETYEKYKGLYDPIDAEIAKYTASQAYDERDAITQELANRLAQIEQDELNVANRISASNEDLNNYQFSDYKLIDPLTQMNVGYGLYNQDEEEEEDFTLPQSAFYQNIIKV
tara:strand:+ start:8315 stop:10795 length:2481 start_codon:yes stop_codon:yes gene_type:complete